jgi:hypothetical protein
MSDIHEAKGKHKKTVLMYDVDAPNKPRKYTAKR